MGASLFYELLNERRYILGRSNKREKMQKLLNVQEASNLLGLAVPTIYKYVCCRKIPYIKVGGRVFFNIERLESWINDLSVDPIASVVLKKRKRDSKIS